MCTVKDLKIFLGAQGMTVGQTRSLIYKMLDNLDEYRDENQRLLVQDRNDYKPRPLVYNTQKVTVNASARSYR